MRSSQWTLAAVAACMLLAYGVTAEAQVCGDADDSGAVTVTDGVQALRAAASLSSTCDTNSNCDVDGSGAVTVSDGVNILRKAAELPISEACVSSVDNQLETLLRSTVPIFGGLTKIVAPSGKVGAADAPCENVEGTVEFDETTNEIFFFDCNLEGFTYDGSIGIDPSTNAVVFDIEFTDLATDEFFSFFAELSSRQDGENVIVAGPLEYSSSLLGDLVVQFEDVVIDPAGNSIGGSLFFDAADSDIEGVAGIRLGFTPSTVVPVQVVFTDQTTRDFNFDIVSGELTPAASN